MLTTQLFFDDGVSDAVFAKARRIPRKGERDQRNDSDGIFDSSLVMTVKEGGGGYRGVMTFDVSRA